MQRSHVAGPPFVPVPCCSTSASRGSWFGLLLLLLLLVLTLPQLRVVAGEDVDTECDDYDVDTVPQQPNSRPLEQEQLVRFLEEPPPCTELYCNSGDVNGTCVINRSVQADQICGFFKGDVVITSNATIKASKHVEVHAGGAIHVNGSVHIIAGHKVHFSAGEGGVWLTDRANVTASDVILETTINATISSIDSVDREDRALKLPGTARGPVTLDGNAAVTGRQCVSVLGGRANIAGNATVKAERRVILGAQEVCTQIIISGKAIVEGKVVAVRCNGSSGGNFALNDLATVKARTMCVNTKGDVDFKSWLFKMNSNAENPALYVISKGAFNLNLSGRLLIRRLVAKAGSIALENVRISTPNASSCKNSHSTNNDICRRVLKEGQEAPPVDVSFDFMLAANTSLTLDSTAVQAGSMLFCSGQALDFKSEVLLDANRRGCACGTGNGSGQTNCTRNACYSGGGSCIGSGGSGAAGDAKGHVVDVPGASAGPNQSWPAGTDLLPTMGSPGGGCKTPDPPCSVSASSVGLAGAGGGLIWLSGNDVSVVGDANLTAIGGQGAVLAADNKSQPCSISGGGAGGQIILWSYNTLTIDGQGKLRLSVTGGPIFCGQNLISGAGGGGFIGIHNAGNLEPESIPLLDFLGGGMPDEEEPCQSFYRQPGLEHTKGQPGIALPLLPCSPGLFGAFCQKCQRGKWSPGNYSLTCQDCTNKPPSNANYSEITGWPNKSCPYTCTRGVPNILINKDCQDALSFVFGFFGGVRGVTAIMSCLVVLAGFLLWRRTGKGKRRCCRERHAESFRETGRLQQRRNWGQHEESFHGDDLLFTRNKLPYHVCRVYLDGKNRGPLPWHLSERLPEVVEPLVMVEKWDSFAQAVNSAAKIHKCGLALEAILRFLYPPLASVCSFWHARQRSTRVRRCVQGFSAGIGERVTLWRPLGARAPAGELTVLFGCDAGATLGHLDFLDSSRSRLDWAPGDLRQECRLLVAHGDGSYMDPFALDMSDPLVTHLSQSDFGPVAICSAISTFNRIARTVRSDELTGPGPQPTIARLRQKVEQCAMQCGLAGFVQVLAVKQYAPLQPERRSPRRSVMEVSSQASFSDLMQRRRGGSPERRATVAPAASSSPLASSVLSSGYPSQKHSPPEALTADQSSLTATSGSDTHPQAMDVKLCLAFVDLSMLMDCWSPARASTSCGPIGSLPHCAVFTSPMSHTGLSQFMERNCTSPLGAVAEAEPPDSARRQPTWLSRLLAREREGSTTPTTVLLVTMVLLALDFLSFIVAGTMFFEQPSCSAFLLWILVPPLAQLVAFVLGPVFMLSELPRLGRLFALFNACGIVSLLIATCTLMAQLGGESIIFNLLGLLTVFSIKAALFIAANIHTGNLEAALDLSFMDAPQGHFINNVLSHDSPLASQENAGSGMCLNEGCPSTNHGAGNHMHQSIDYFNLPEDALFSRACSLSDQGAFRPPRDRSMSHEDSVQSAAHIDVHASPF